MILDILATIFCSFIMSDLSKSLMVTHLSWATWVIRSRSLICLERPEPFAHCRSFVLSDLTESLTVAHLIWAKWAIEWMSEFPALLQIYILRQSKIYFVQLFSAIIFQVTYCNSSMLSLKGTVSGDSQRFFVNTLYLDPKSVFAKFNFPQPFQPGARYLLCQKGSKILRHRPFKSCTSTLPVHIWPWFPSL